MNNLIPIGLRVAQDLLVDPLTRGWLPRHQLILLEPEADLLLCTLHTITTMTDVSVGEQQVLTFPLENFNLSHRPMWMQ